MRSQEAWAFISEFKLHHVIHFFTVSDKDHLNLNLLIRFFQSLELIIIMNAA